MQRPASRPFRVTVGVVTVGTAIAMVVTAIPSSAAGNRAAPSRHKGTAISGLADIFAAGRAKVPAFAGGGGKLPVKFNVRHDTMTVSSVTGAVWCDASQAPTDSPNGPCAGVRTPTNLKSFGHISGIIDRNSNDFLVGVFLGKDKPGKPTPPRLNFSKSKLGTNFKKLAPELDQTFFIGTGRTKSGDLHKYKVPKHATRLYLGIADGYGFGGDPGYYDDNGGKYRVKVHFK